MAVARERASATLSSQPRRRLGELFSGLYSPPSGSLAISRAACGSSLTLRLSSRASSLWRSKYPRGATRRTTTCPKTRPSGAPSTHAAKASREPAAAFSWHSERASDNRLLCHRPTGAGSYEVRHRRVRSDGGAVEDRLVVAEGNLALQAEVLRDRLASVPALRDKQGDQDHILRLDTIDDAAYLGVLIQEPDLDEIVDPTLPDASGVEVDDAAGVLVQVGSVAEQDEGRASRDLFSSHEAFRTLQDDIRHPLEGAQRTGVADGFLDLPGDGPFQT